MPPVRRRPGNYSPAPDIRTIFLDKPSTDLRPSYEELSSLVSSHPEIIASRWRKKNTALRSKCLARAWSAASSGKKIPERRPRLSEKLLGDPQMDFRTDPLKYLDMEEFLFACVNVEQLANSPASLLNLIYSRSIKHPSHFGRSDYINFVKPVLQLFRLMDDGKRMKGTTDIVMIQADESDYGVVKTWSRQSEDYRKGIQKILICNVDCEGTWLVKWQKAIIDFCLCCVKDILGPGDLQSQTGVSSAEKLLENVPNYSISGGVAESRSASLLTLPYTVPKEFNLQSAHTRALTHLRAAEDSVNLLRSDPDYLLSQVELRLAHRAEHIPDMFGRLGNAESSESVQDAVAKIIHTSYSTALIWNEICIHFEDAIQLMSGKQGSWWSSGSNPVLDEKIAAIDALLSICESFSETTIAIHVNAGPQLRCRFFRAETISFIGKMSIGALPGVTPSSVYMENPIDGLLMCMCSKNTSRWEPQIFNLKVIANEIEHILTTDRPDLKSHVHPWLMNVLSDTAAVYEIRENIARHVPSRESANYSETAGVISSVSMAIGEFARMWPQVDLSAFLGNDEMGWQRLRKTRDGDGLGQFWKLVDTQVRKLTQGKTLEGWIQSNKGRLAKRRKGRWMWQGKVWLAEGAIPEGEEDIVGEEESEELPRLIAVAGFDDSEGYGEGQLLGDVFGTENIQQSPARLSSQEITQDRQEPEALISKPQQTKKQEKEKPLIPKPESQPIPERPFGVNAEGSRGTEPEPVPIPKEKQKTRPAGVTIDIESKLGSIDINETPRDQKQPTIYVSKRVYQNITCLSVGTPLAWKEFMHLMVSLGFTVRPVGGSVVRFTPENEGDEPINLHRPHPDAILGKYECLWIWKRLKRNYGWEAGMFERESGMRVRE